LRDEGRKKERVGQGEGGSERERGRKNYVTNRGANLQKFL